MRPIRARGCYRCTPAGTKRGIVRTGRQPPARPRPRARRAGVTFSCSPPSWQRGAKPMKIKLTTVYVDDQDKALRFYTDVLGFVKKADFSNGPYRWLTVASADELDGTQLQLARNDNPAAKAYQQAIFQQNQPAANFITDDAKADYERMKARGAEF